MVYEVDWNGEVFDSSSDGFGLKDIDARLAVLEKGEGSDVGLLKTNKLADALEKDTALRSIRSTTGFGLSRVEGYNFLLGCFPIDSDTIDEGNKVVT